MDAKKVDRGFQLQGEAMHRELTPAEREELMLLHAEAAAELRTPPELADPDGDGPKEAQRPMLDGSDSLENFRAADRRGVAKRVETGIVAIIGQFLKGLLFK